MRFSFLIPAALAALIAGAAQATPNPAAPAVSPTPPSAAPIVFCPQVIVPPACRGVTSGGGGGTVVGHGHRVVTTRYSRRMGAGAGHRGGGESYAYARRSALGYGRYASSRYDVTVRTGRARVRGGDEGQYARVERNDYDVDNRRDRNDDRGEGRVRQAGPGSGAGYHDTWSGYGGRYGTGDRGPSRGYGYRYSEEGSDRVIEHRRVEGSGGGYRDGQSYSYSYRSPPQVSVYEHHDYRGEDRRSPPPAADRYDRHDDGDRDDRARGHGHDVDDRDGDDDDKGPGGDAGDHHRYAGGDDRDQDGRGHDHDGHGAGGHREIIVIQHDGHGRGGHGGDGYAYGGANQGGHGYAYGSGYAGSSSASSYSSSSSSHGYSAYGARFYSGGDCHCQPVRGNGYYAFSQGDDGALTWQNRDDDQ